MELPRHLSGLGWLVATISLLTFPKVAQGQFIPGTSNTINGYDKADGSDSICWKSYGAPEGEGFSFESPLIHDFVVDQRGIEMLSACPMGNNVTGTQPIEHTVYGERLRTRRLYDYPVTLNFNLTSLRASRGFTSDRGPGYIVLQIFNCVAGLSGFCSPFVHEQTIARQIAAAIAAAAANPSASGGPPPPWRYIPGDLHGGSHAHSGWLYAVLPPEEGPIFQNVEIKIPQLVMQPGDYYTIVAVQLHFWEDTEDGSDPVLVRYDIANKLEGRQSLTYYYDPPVIQEVDPGVLCASYVFIGLAGAALVFLLFQTVKHMQHQVMRLSQGIFLSLFLMSGLVATVSSFLMEPKSDLYCRASVPLVIISLHTFYAVTIGRLWRIHSLISPLLLKSLAVETPMARFKRRVQESCCWRFICPSGNNPRKIRSQVTERQLSVLIAILVAPQVALQVLVLFLQPSRREIEFNEDESKGRAKCDTEGDLALAQTLLYWGYALFVLLILGLLVMAFQSRKLPSLFDESQKIFDSTVTTFTILIMGVAIILVTDDPETSPSVSYLVWIFVILSITTNTSIRIILPKLRMIWRGETVIVSQLVLDHTREVRSSNMRSSVAAGSGTGDDGSRPATGILYDGNSIMNSNVNQSSVVRKSSSKFVDQSSSFSDPEKHSIISRATDVEEQSQSEAIANEDEPSAEHAPATSRNSKGSNVLSNAAAKYASKHGLNAGKKPHFVIESDQAPSRRVLLKMVDLQEHLNRITQRIMSGMAVSEEDWEQARSLGGKFGSMMNDDVAFSWEAVIAEEEGEEENSEDFSPEKAAL